MIIQPGEFWVADIPFTDGSGSKRRPVLVLWIDAVDVVAAVVTTASPRSKTDVALLWVTLLGAMDAPLTSFGDSTGPISDLRV